MYTGKHAMSDDSIDVVVDSVESNQYRSPKNPKFKSNLRLKSGKTQTSNSSTTSEL